MPELAYVNGSFVPVSYAVVSIEDRGFQFADSVYEVMVAYSSEPYAIGRHLDRLQRSLREISVAFDVIEGEIEGAVAEGVRRSGFTDTLIYIQITRGVAPRHHEFPRTAMAPTVVMTFKECRRLEPQLYETGVRVVTVPDQRWRRCDIKSTALLPNVLAKQQAVEAGAFEALLVDGEDRVIEASSTSSFCVVGGTVLTAPAGPHILPGITRGILLELAREIDVPLREEFCIVEQYLKADEVFLAGTTTECLPVIQIDDAVVGSGMPGPVTARLRRAFAATLPAGARRV